MLVKRFYSLMDELPEAWGVRRLHAEDLGGSEEKLFLFLSGWLGGPNLYVERFGPPFMRARHLPSRLVSPSATSGCCACALRSTSASAMRP
ncbi:hypothetical protein [Thauera humireducens]|uniref:globin domain-containing protein n=1 Tax=Thauera humireducens TaxID=1134435 RepID=UPI00311E3B0E